MKFIGANCAMKHLSFVLQVGLLEESN